MFITKIFKMKYYFDSKKLKNIFYSENEIFNIPFSVESFFSEDNKKNLSTINLNLIKLNIENELIFENDKKIGKSIFFPKTVVDKLGFPTEASTFGTKSQSLKASVFRLKVVSSSAPPSM